MIVVEAQLKSAISASRDATLCRVEIANVGGSDTRGEYVVRLYSRGDHARLIRTARLHDFPRKALPAWRLIAAAFQALDVSDAADSLGA